MLMIVAANIIPQIGKGNSNKIEFHKQFMKPIYFEVRLKTSYDDTSVVDDFF